jgi:hypothetical protein
VEKDITTKALWLSVHPSQGDVLPIQFAPGPALQRIKETSNLAKGESLQYRFAFVAHNGGRLLNSGNTDGQEGAFVEQREFNAIASKSGGQLDYGPSDTIGTLVAEYFGTPEMHLETTKNGCSLVLNIPITGDPAVWKKCDISVTLTGGAKPIPSINATINKEGTLATARIAIGNKTGLYKIAAKAGPKKGTTAYPNQKFDSVELQYDFTPKLLGGILSSKTIDIFPLNPYLLLSAQTTGIEPPPQGGSAWGFTGKATIPDGGIARDLCITVTPDESAILDKKTLKPAKVSELIEFALPAGKGKGYCDNNGHFEAKVLISQLKPKTAYTFRLERKTGDGKIRTILVRAESGMLYLEALYKDRFF